MVDLTCKPVILFLAVSIAAHGQATFEVASIRLAPQPVAGAMIHIGASGGPGTPNPERFNCYCQLSELLTLAYDTSLNLLGVPDWTREVWLEVAAKVPPGTTKDTFLQMQQSLLAERFKLVVHHEKKAVPVYELLVARGGLKIKELDTAGQPGGPVQRQPPKTNTVDAEGFPVFLPVPLRLRA